LPKPNRKSGATVDRVRARLHRVCVRLDAATGTGTALGNGGDARSCGVSLINSAIATGGETRGTRRASRSSSGGRSDGQLAHAEQALDEPFDGS
jgi:hypothetical protein